MSWVTKIKNRYTQEKTHIKSVQLRNTRIFKQQPWKEISGSFGDIGTFIPIFIALVGTRDYHQYDQGIISASSTLVFSGLFNVLTGLYFGIPLPVQPMKAIAAVAIASPGDYNQARYASAGIFVAVAVAILSLTGLVQWFTKNVPVPIVKGIQVGAGLSLIISAFTKLQIQTWSSWKPGFNTGLDHLLTLAGVLLFLLLCSTRPRIPFVFVVVGVCIVVGLVIYVGNVVAGLYHTNPSIWRPETLVPSNDDFAFGAFNAGLGQLPLTTLNSIVAVVFLAEDLFPEASTPSATAVGLSVAAMNLLGCWFKAMPVCHGSGGLAAQYRFGARSGSSIIFLGVLKIVLGLFISELVVQFCKDFPVPFLAVLLLLAGVELVKMGENLNGEGARDLWKKDGQGSTTTNHFEQPNHTEGMRRYLVMMVTIGAILGSKNDGIGFVVGLVVHYAFRFQEWEESRQRRRGEIRLEDNEQPST